MIRKRSWRVVSADSFANGRRTRGAGRASSLCTTPNGIPRPTLEIRGTTGLQPELATLRIPAQPYAVFLHTGHISKMRPSVHTVFNRWVPELGLEMGVFPSFIERYGMEFDPETGMGEVELWVPLARA